MFMPAEVLNSRISKAIEVVRSTLKGLPEGDDGVPTFRVVTVLTDIEEALLGISDAPGTRMSETIEPDQELPLILATRPQPESEVVSTSFQASETESDIDEGGEFVIGLAPEPNKKNEEKLAADKQRGRHGSHSLAELARQKAQRFHAEREKAARFTPKSSKHDSRQTDAQRIRAAQRSTGL